MTWVRIDDQFPEHPKIAAAGPLAGWLHICGLCYCNRMLTDGFIPDAVAKRLAMFDNIDVELADTNGGMVEKMGADAVAQILCDLKIWRRVAGGFAIHDYLEYQPSKAEIEAMREQKASAGRAGGLAAAKARAIAKRKQEPKQNPSKTVAHTRTQDHAPKSSSESVSDLPPSSNESPLPENAGGDIDFASPNGERWTTDLDIQTIAPIMEEGRRIS